LHLSSDRLDLDDDCTVPDYTAQGGGVDSEDACVGAMDQVGVLFHDLDSCSYLSTSTDDLDNLGSFDSLDDLDILAPPDLSIWASSDYPGEVIVPLGMEGDRVSTMILDEVVVDILVLVLDLDREISLVRDHVEMLNLDLDDNCGLHIL
jgi:hypothetical protein